MLPKPAAFVNASFASEKSASAGAADVFLKTYQDHFEAIALSVSIKESAQL